MEELRFVRDYFNAEQSESVAFLVIGLVSVLGGIGLLIYYGNEWKERLAQVGFALVFIALGMLETTTGTAIYFRSPEDIQRVERYFGDDPELMQTEEIPRMETVMDNFVVYRWVEIGFIGLSIIALIFFYKIPLIRGLAAGMLIQAPILLALDYFAEKRGGEYLSTLIEIVNQ